MQTESPGEKKKFGPALVSAAPEPRIWLPGDSSAADAAASDRLRLFFSNNLKMKRLISWFSEVNIEEEPTCQPPEPQDDL